VYNYAEQLQRIVNCCSSFSLKSKDFGELNCVYFTLIGCADGKWESVHFLAVYLIINAVEIKELLILSNLANPAKCNITLSRDVKNIFNKNQFLN